MTDTGNTVTENTYTGNTDTCNDRIAVARMINLASYKGYLDTDYENVAKDYNLSRELEAKKNNLIHESKNAENIFYETVEELIKAKNELSEAIEELEYAKNTKSEMIIKTRDVTQKIASLKENLKILNEKSLEIIDSITYAEQFIFKNEKDIKQYNTGDLEDSVIFLEYKTSLDVIDKEERVNLLEKKIIEIENRKITYPFTNNDIELSNTVIKLTSAQNELVNANLIHNNALKAAKEVIETTKYKIKRITKYKDLLVKLISENLKIREEINNTKESITKYEETIENNKAYNTIIIEFNATLKVAEKEEIVRILECKVDALKNTKTLALAAYNDAVINARKANIEFNNTIKMVENKYTTQQSE